MYLYARRYDQAEHHLSRAAAMNPESEETYRVLGLVQAHAGALDAALATVPRAISPKDFGALEALGADSWRLCAAHEDGPPRDLFVEAPEGWWLKTAPAQANESRDCFTLTVGDKPKGAALPVTLRLTLTGGAGAVETRMETGQKS